MSRIPIVENNYYHLYNRGVDRRKIFFNLGNWYFFLARVEKYFISKYVDILSYCLMPNHYHFLVYVKKPQFGNRVMHPFGTSYTKAINKQQNRIGPIFQGTYLAKHVGDEAYLLHLTRYIHINQVAIGLVTSPADWEFSSFRDYAEMRHNPMIEKEIVLSRCSSPQSYVDFVHDIKTQNGTIPEIYLFDD